MGIKIERSISPTNPDTRLKTKRSKRTVTLNKDVYEIVNTLIPKENDYLFDPDGFQQSAKLARLLKKLDIPRTTFHGLRDTHTSFLFSNDNIRLDYISQRLGHSNSQTTMNYYLELMPEKTSARYRCIKSIRFIKITNFSYDFSGFYCQ
ncbi:TPA: tyrosine-type recombinase/integrase, partial [Listeria innocua]